MKWESYASEQRVIPGVSDRTGTSPLKNFDGNYCSSAMGSFQSVGYTQNCPGVDPDKPAVPVPNPLAPPTNASSYGNATDTEVRTGYALADLSG